MDALERKPVTRRELEDKARAYNEMTGYWRRLLVETAFSRSTVILGQCPLRFDVGGKLMLRL